MSLRLRSYEPWRRQRPQIAPALETVPRMTRWARTAYDYWESRGCCVVLARLAPDATDAAFCAASCVALRSAESRFHFAFSEIYRAQ